jgi:hypothetical protein
MTQSRGPLGSYPEAQSSNPRPDHSPGCRLHWASWENSDLRLVSTLAASAALLACVTGERMQTIREACRRTR